MRIYLIALSALLFGTALDAQTLSIYKSEKDVAKTTEIVEKVIKDKGLVYFETVDHESIANDRGVDISPMREVLFEDGDLTTSLIKCQPTTALDLPLKILIWEEHGDVYLAYIDPQFMKKRFMLQGCEEIIDDMGKLLSRLTVDATRAIQSAD